MARPDWAAIRLAYVNGTESLGEVGARFGATPSACQQRSHREGWTEARQKASAAVSAKAQSGIERTRAQEISEWNAGDLRIAKAIRAQVAKHIAAAREAAMNPNDLRTLAAANEAATRLARIALGIAEGNPADEPEGLRSLKTIVVQRKSARKQTA